MKYISLLLLLVFSVNAFAGVNAAVVWEVRSTGATTNGGGFKTGASGTDWTQQDACKYSLTGLTSAGAGNVILTASAAADWVGNVIQIASGTNFTAGFFEITSVSAGVSATVSTNQAGTAVTTGVGASGVGCIGGAFAFGAASTGTFAAGIAPGNTIYFKSGTHTATASEVYTDCTNAAPCTFTGYNATRGDNPTGSSRPTINLQGTQFNPGALTYISNLILTGTAVTMTTSNGQCVWTNNKFTNTSTTSGRLASSMGLGDLILNNELVSQNGIAVNTSGAIMIVGNYIHDSSTGIRSTATGDTLTVLNNILAGNFTNGINVSGANTDLSFISGNTIYGAEGKFGVGLLVASGASDVRVMNNIFYGLTTGVSAAASTANYSNWNDFNNNTTARTNWSTGAQDIATAPGFGNVTTVAGSSGVISGSTLTDSGASFANVVNSQDYVYIASGTGVTAGVYLITGHTGTVLTLATAPGGSGTNIVYTVRTGHNFAVSPTMKFKGFPGLFNGSGTTGYMDLGAAQRHEYGRPAGGR